MALLPIVIVEVFPPQHFQRDIVLPQLKVALIITPVGMVWEEEKGISKVWLF